jgi:hypothetical protein
MLDSFGYRLRGAAAMVWRNAVIILGRRTNYAAEISLLLFFLVALVTVGAPLKADTMIRYRLQGVLDDGGAFTGTFDYNATSRKISSITVSTNPEGSKLPAGETWIKTDLQSGNATGFTADNGKALLTIAFFKQLTGTGTDYVGGAFGGAVIGSDTSTNSDVSKRGTVTAVPEPAKLPIVLLGALVLIGVTPWRRILQAARKHRSVPQVQ